MKALLTEHRNLLIAGVSVLLGVGGCGYFLYQSQTANAEAFESLRTVSDRLTKIQSVTPTPSKDNLEALKAQRELASKALDQLRTNLKALDLPAAPLKPPEFQKVLNEKSQSITKLAEVNGVTMPSNFYFAFNNYTQTVPKDEATPHLGRQLHVAELICKLLIQSVPAELRLFERSELELEKDPSATAKEEPSAKEKEKQKDKAKDGEKGKAKPPAPPTFESSFFSLRFVTRPGPLREFLNALASEKSCILVTRSLKIENEKQKGPPKRGPEDLLPPGSPGAANPAASPLSPAVPIPSLDPLAGPSGSTSSAEISQFIVGDEKIEVSLRVEFISFLQEPAKESPKTP